MPKPQSYSSHTRFDPPFHFFIVPVLLANICFAIYLAFRDWPAHARLHLWEIVMAFALVLLALTVRRYAAKNQDRLIRLEERLRLASLLPGSHAGVPQALTTRQLVALRFASDAELPALAQRAAAESLPPAEIKKIIAAWRPDHERI